jgi:hypothetical protein
MMELKEQVDRVIAFLADCNNPDICTAMAEMLPQPNTHVMGAEEELAEFRRGLEKAIGG